MSDLRFINPPTMPPTRGYTHVVEATAPARIVYLSGQLGYTADGRIASDFRGQATQAFENLRAALAAVGGEFKHVVKFTCFFVDMGDLPSYLEIRDRFVDTAAPPASTAVQISKLARDAALFEIEAVAVLPPK